MALEAPVRELPIVVIFVAAHMIILLIPSVFIGWFLHAVVVIAMWPWEKLQLVSHGSAAAQIETKGRPEPID